MPDPAPPPAPPPAQPPGAPPHRGTRRERALVVVGIVVLGFNLRPAAVSVGPVLAEITDALSMGSLAAGLLTSLPVVAFGAFGATAPAAARRLGTHRLTVLCLLGVVVGLLARALTSSAAVFLVASVVGLAGMAMANVLLPSLIKLHFAERVGLFTALYTTAMAIGLTAASVLTVPLATALGSWRWGIGVWAAAAALAAVPWLLLVRHDLKPGATRRRISVADVARTRLGMAMAVMFGLQSAHAYTIFGWFAQVYRDAGFSAATAGLLLGVVAGISIPISLWVPSAAGRRRDQTPLLWALIACYPVGYLGLVVAPVEGAWLWALLVGTGAGVFPLVLTLIGLRSRTPDGTAALSGFAQSAGYAISALGPVGIGALYGATGGWTWPLLTLTASTALMAALAPAVGRPGHVEDQLVRLSSSAPRQRQARRTLPR
ncbi:MAG TPA: MFS transporter [Marmoricola sp.]|nr:MFS transporter [Marmoricola sp.]